MTYRVCAYRGCDRHATQLACGRENEYDQPAYFCDEHASIVADVASPEYIVTCPCCDCKFGVN